MKAFWNDRYALPAYAYGEAPNDYFARQIQQFQAGRLLLPAEGEGRNAVFAAQLGWEVCAFDISEKGKEKADRLAHRQDVKMDYQVRSFAEIDYQPDSFDAIGLIFAHFPPEVKAAYYQQLDQYLKPGGVVIGELFSKKHLAFRAVNPRAGGPPNLDMLFSTEEIRSYFPNYEFLELTETEVTLAEGAYHQGKSSVIRFVGRKPH